MCCYDFNEKILKVDLSQSHKKKNLSSLFPKMWIGKRGVTKSSTIQM